MRRVVFLAVGLMLTLAGGVGADDRVVETPRESAWRDHMLTAAEARRGEWSSAAIRVSALEHLDERGRAVHAVEYRRDEAKTADDIVTTRWDRP